MYRIAFPDQRQLSHSTFAVFCNVAETGSVAPQSMTQGRPRSAHMPDHEEYILQAVGDDPSISILQVAITCHTSHSTTRRVLQEHLLYLYHLLCVQGLTPSDHSPWENFC